jgi:hypothetical protein
MLEKYAALVQVMFIYFTALNNNNMAAVQEFSLAFDLVAVTNEPLEFGL